MSQATITRRYRFCAAHRLHTDQLSAEENWATFGKCNNPNGHGHNYVVFVSVKGDIDPVTHQVLDVSRLDAVVERIVVQRFDHQDLNLDPEFATQTTTGENLVLLIWDLLVDKLPAGRLVKVGVIETRDNYFEYSGSVESKRREEGVRHG
ncbi:MAG TPA: 6-carboxytetrahydropterin synthase [Nitrospira sp.]|jgi:6-pyruvoyltetrahydropterin/6-carboxytetrahydropterin synthase|uniref:6-carboxytetrahydropterin synthase n=1 Tax=Nitrospira sp. ND1 TaxID=1658518 RepID=UPI0009C6D135|nr:6-carboxytetrahydropterin synthase [Nitrospira sp. ND1]MBP6199697.1 6-carboxytetrahydropterin synthase [Nitrospira sp.]MBP6207580.1 6-carboxytetrahydropterin synthase [Nitrospira sp.]MBP7360669.1 6-carboxytetrahydropterin synthase [Nitrospira sp.]MBP8103559.1 6-carboxytetrahydropterin synthase [Nitrospira sp.]MBP8199236.1 6-carboxytetrahydropterin synthase [Nitrospira sp.]